jgi:hypothetical protein
MEAPVGCKRIPGTEAVVFRALRRRYDIVEEVKAKLNDGTQ